VFFFISSCFEIFLLGCAILLYYLSVNSCFNLSQRGSIFSFIFSSLSSHSLCSFSINSVSRASVLNFRLLPWMNRLRGTENNHHVYTEQYLFQTSKGRISNFHYHIVYYSNELLISFHLLLANQNSLVRSQGTFTVPVA
jgi:hypothetical protein